MDWCDEHHGQHYLSLIICHLSTNCKLMIWKLKKRSLSLVKMCFWNTIAGLCSKQRVIIEFHMVLLVSVGPSVQHVLQSFNIWCWKDFTAHLFPALVDCAADLCAQVAWRLSTILYPLFSHQGPIEIKNRFFQRVLVRAAAQLLSHIKQFHMIGNIQYITRHAGHTSDNQAQSTQRSLDVDYVSGTWVWRHFTQGQIYIHGSHRALLPCMELTWDLQRRQIFNVVSEFTTFYSQFCGWSRAYGNGWTLEFVLHAALNQFSKRKNSVNSSNSSWIIG